MGTFNYYSEDDALEYDYEAAMPVVRQMESDLKNAYNELKSLVSSLEKLQNDCHDKAGSSITEDYKDFSSLVGNEQDGVGGFINDANNLIESIETTLESFHNQTH